MKSGSFDVVPVTGIEPVRSLEPGILSPVRLPVPPHRHFLKGSICALNCQDKAVIVSFMRQVYYYRGGVNRRITNNY